jgi:hypothetical protein
LFSREKEVVKMTIEAAKMKHEERLMRLPNVTGVGIGEKEGKAVIVVFVAQKVPASTLQPQELIPKRLESYATVTAQIK